MKSHGCPGPDGASCTGIPSLHWMGMWPPHSHSAPKPMVSFRLLADLLRMFFDCLYDEEVISEDAFYKWESSKDPAEQNGKGVALKSVTAFFTWLREAEEESEDN